jgi:hypothetical protein
MVAMRHSGDKRKKQKSFIQFAIRIFGILCEKRASAVTQGPLGSRRKD